MKLHAYMTAYLQLKGGATRHLMQLVPRSWRTMRTFSILAVVSLVLLAPEEIQADAGEMVVRVLLRQWSRFNLAWSSEQIEVRTQS